MASDGPKASDFPVIMETLTLHERIAALEADLAKEKAENARMREALERIRDPAPSVKKLPPWAYGIIVPALT